MARVLVPGHYCGAQVPLNRTYTTAKSGRSLSFFLSSSTRATEKGKKYCCCGLTRFVSIQSDSFVCWTAQTVCTDSITVTGHRKHLRMLSIVLTFPVGALIYRRSPPPMCAAVSYYICQPLPNSNNVSGNFKGDGRLVPSWSSSFLPLAVEKELCFPPTRHSDSAPFVPRAGPSVVFFEGSSLKLTGGRRCCFSHILFPASELWLPSIDPVFQVVLCK